MNKLGLERGSWIWRWRGSGNLRGFRQGVRARSPRCEITDLGANRLAAVVAKTTGYTIRRARQGVQAALIATELGI